MAGSYNRIILVGNLTRDPEIRYVQTGSAVTKFALAVNRRTKGGNETTFVDIVAWDNGSYKLAETCNTYLKKGMSILVEGRLVIRRFEDKDGNARKATEIVIDQMQMLNPKNADNGDDRYDDVGDRRPSTGSQIRPEYKRGSGNGGSTTDTTKDDFADDEIPFRKPPDRDRFATWVTARGL